MRILITGGLGNLGSWLTEHLVQSGHEVTVLASRKRKVLEDLDVHFLACDITDKDQVQEVLQDVEFDTVIHAASANEFFDADYDSKSLMVNAYGTRNLAEVFSKNKELKNFIYLSTFHVYGAGEGSIDEESPLLPRNDYAITHLFGEEYVKFIARTSGLPHTIIRLSNSYGCPKEMDSSKWYLVLNDLARSAFEQKEIIIKTNGKASRDFIWMGDVCHAFDQLVNLNQANNETYNLSSQRNFEILEIANYVAQAYEETFGEELPIRINEDDHNEYKSVEVRSDKLRNLITLNTTLAFKDEAIKILALLQSQ